MAKQIKYGDEARKALREQNLTSDTAPVELNERELRARECPRRRAAPST